jgi:tetratricopeptide (TPR) repeat protein
VDARRAAILICLSAIPAGRVVSQQSPGLELERRGRYEEAAKAYRATLQSDFDNAAAWLGFERVLTRLDSLRSLPPLLDSGLASDPTRSFLREMKLRVWGALGDEDSLRVAAEQWMIVAPGSPDPYRHWSLALSRRGRTASALSVLQTGRAELGGTALAPELAQAYAAVGVWMLAAEEWSAAVLTSESYTASAVAGLREAQEPDRGVIIAVLTDPSSDPVLRRLGAALLIVWGRPEEGWTLLDSSLPRDREEAARVLMSFADQTGWAGTHEAARARGYAMERLSQLTEGRESEHARLAAAQAFADAGDLNRARRMLETLPDHPGEAQADAAAAMATLIRVILGSGRLEEAETRFRIWEDRLSVDDARRLREDLGWEWIIRGDLERAERLLQQDSTISTQALMGWIAVYRGNLREATERFRAAGPYARSRDEATRRTTMLAIMQSIEPDTVPALGAALMTLAHGDTANSIDQLRQVARELPESGGGSHVLTYAGDLALARGDYDRAEPLLLAALAADSIGSAAPLAEYSLSVVYDRTGRSEQALTHLEHLILTFPGSAIVPDARRLLNQVQGAIPKS